jgi:HAD superfamily hydrolase (TIGR01509 family)
VLSAVIWDCDGVLVDSEPLADEIWGRVLAQRGYALTAEDAAACRGMSDVAFHAYLSDRADLLPYDAHMAAIDALRVPIYEERLEAFPDAARAVRELVAHGIPMGVASSSRREAVDHKLALTGLGRFITAVVGGDEVATGKPAPDVYLAAADRLGIAPASCIAVEDAELGAEAAHAAGMRVVMVRRDGSLSADHATVTEVTADLILSWMGR